MALDSHLSIIGGNRPAARQAFGAFFAFRNGPHHPRGDPARPGQPQPGPQICLTLSELLGVPLPQAASATALPGLVTLVMVRAVVRGVDRRRARGGRLRAVLLHGNVAVWTTMPALAGVVLPAFTGHATASGRPTVALRDLAGGDRA